MTSRPNSTPKITQGTEISGWGRFPRHYSRVASPTSQDEVASFAGHGRLIARGNGRAYGDAAIGSALTLDMCRMNRMLSFDPTTGILVAEAGVILGDIIEALLPRGWFPSVTPGTKFVSLGGAIAADVHGKNHHLDGSFSSFVEWVDVLDGHGELRRCSRTQDPELFSWTLGGMGLTGIILRAAIRLRPVESGWITLLTRPAPNLSAAMDAFEEAQDATYSVAWIDCLAAGNELGRSLIMLGEHAKANEVPRAFRRRPYASTPRRRLSVPLDAPGWALNRYTVKAFNALYWSRGRKGPARSVVDWDSYFYPLDGVLGWNRIYGRKGFVQFQCALPVGASEAGLTALLDATSHAGLGSFLAVLKRFGAQDSRISFPMDGYTLALDFPASPAALALLDRLDAITLDHGGRFYLAKDARLAPERFHASDPRAATFREMRQAHGLRDSFASRQSERIML
jgi:decaprenylphospho-beta-D-ribofuranose 2-oxidase